MTERFLGVRHCVICFHGVVSSVANRNEKRWKDNRTGLGRGPVDTLSVLTWLHLWGTLYHILAAFHSGVCTALVSSWDYLWPHWGQPSVNAQHPLLWWRILKWITEFPRESLECLHTSDIPHLNRQFIDLSPFFASFCYLWVLGFLSQIHCLNPSLCLGIFWGTQTETVIYCGQQVPSTRATLSIPVVLTDMPVDHGFFPLNLENASEFSEQPVGADHYWHVGWNPLPIPAIKNQC